MDTDFEHTLLCEIKGHIIDKEMGLFPFINLRELTYNEILSSAQSTS